MSEPVVLVVDDEEGIRESLSDIFRDEGYAVITAASAEEAVKTLKEQAVDLVMLDVWLQGMDGIEALGEIRGLHSDLPVIMISGHGNIEMAVKATRMGAYDFLEKPLSLDRIVLSARRALERKRLETENKALRETLSRKSRLIGRTPGMQALMEQIKMAAPSSSRVLVYGESGTGKELVAKLLHDLSPRAKMPFVEVNCAAIPQELIESELFGHEKGSFTGAFEQKKGKLELADSGTLFLDEIGDMSLTTQSKLLRAIETQEFQRVGGSKNIKVDLRVIAATNKDLREEAKKGAFREDLYFRLSVIPITIPPLRERKEDIRLLARHFLEAIASEYGRPAKVMTEEAVECLFKADWPGNVRELRNTIERLVIMVPSEVIEARHLFSSELGRQDYFMLSALKDARDAFERDYLLRKLGENGWNISKTAEAVGIERSNLHRKIKAYGINMP
ncbi:MAG: sigma-54 dependent transcriptional regulator [Thermodesulfovibrionales bacterium]|nr:sigma-54 dependent transcriptional regulator [Thermodesulfovibrionales bacterium]